ncbi:DUF1934 domain-containing protein [Clostridium sp. ATCC 25772]|uniref:DUF1934 domain-containing protein n=1 Tax=Clostridium sp. ATCC 25772 TaxID=1676991 RepID=UPI000AABE755|nr:DUF1934 domain-containing protein [Clostridium sp. ATCC 25772]
MEKESIKKEAIISIISTQGDDGAVEVVTAGSFYKEDGYYYATYEETEASGMEDTNTTLKINETGFSLIREGSITTKMNFERNKEDDILYSTPHGGLSLKIRTKSIKIDIGDFGGEIKVEYDMSAMGQPPLETKLIAKITIKE